MLRIRHFLVWIPLLAFMAAPILISEQAAADSDAAICESATGEAIAACTRLINSGKEKGAVLAKIYRDRCAALNRDHQPDRALADCNEALRLDPGQTAAHTGRGDSYRGLRDFDRSVAEYSETIRADPKNIAALWGRCSSLANKNELDRALADCNAAIRINDKYAAPYATRCFIMTSKRDLDRATADCDHAVQLDPKYPLAFNARGILLRNKREYERAIADLSEAIRLDPKLAIAYNNRAWSFIDKRDYDRAVADYGEVIRLEPKYVQGYAGRCWALYLKKDYDRALRDCDQAIAIDAKPAYLFLRRGLIWVEQRDFDRAIADYTQAIRIDPKYSAAFYDRGLAWGQRRDLDRAIADFSEAIKLNAQYADAYMQRGYAYRQKRDYDRAIADFEQAARINPKSMFAFSARGLVWLDKRDYDRAVSDFDAAIRLDSNYTAAFTNRGLALERKGEPERARKDFEAALALPEKYRDGRWAHDTARERLAALPPAQSSSATAAPDSKNDPESAHKPQRTTIERGPRIALLIANKDYPDTDPPLSQAAKDVRSLADELKRMGFETEVAQNLPKLGLQRAIEDFNKKLNRGAIALFYFSGYGLQTNHQTYLLPTDARIWNEADIRRDGTNLEAVLQEMNGHGAAVKLAIIDASRRNPYERRFRAAAAGLAPVSVAKDSLIIYSGGLGQIASDTTGEQSVFMSELLKELRSPGVSADDVFARTRIGVSRATDAEQVPWVASSLVESFYFVPFGPSTAGHREAR